MITSKTPKLDLHGEISSMCFSLVNQFITDCFNMHEEVAIIIHGKSTNILTREVHKILKDNKHVNKYYIDNWNLGQTIVFLNVDK